MTKAEEIFEKHIGLNAELRYKKIKKENVIDAINEALNHKRTLINFLLWHSSENLGFMPDTIEKRVDEYLKIINK